MEWAADIGSNHNGDLDRAIVLIQTAADVGCTGVKFQLFNDEIGKPPREWLPVKWLPTLRDAAHYNGLKFGCTPGYLRAVDELEPYVDYYKIATSMNSNKELVVACADTGKPMVISGIGDGGCTLLYATQLHCIPKYPVDINQCKLRLMGTCEGWSDHSRQPAVIYRAVHRWSCRYIEFHLDLDGEGWEYHFGHCWLPEEIKAVIQTVKEGFEAD